MISRESRTLLERYTLAARVFTATSGDRLAKEAGQSVEFQDFRPYQPGDELRYVDWKVYGRTGRLYTRLYQAERTTAVHVLLDTSRSMVLGHKAGYARIVAQLLCYAAQLDSLSQIHLFGGQRSAQARGRAQLPISWSFIENAPEVNQTPSAGLKEFALHLPPRAGTGLVLVISDLFDETPLRQGLAALKVRGLDASFLQLVAERDLEPEEGQLELTDSETGDKLQVGPAEVRAYRQAVQRFIERTRATILQAGFRYSLLKTTGEDPATLEKDAFAALVKSGVLIKR